MATPHPALEAAVQHFAQQPGVTPAQVAAMQAALASDPDLAQRLDGAATAGTIRGFAPSVPGTPNRPIGEYDRGSGIVTLSPSAFSTSSSTGDLQAVLRVQSMIVDFGGKTYSDASGATYPVTPDMLTNLQGTLNGSPVLADEIKRAATTADPTQPQNRILESFQFTAPGAGVGGSFSPANHAMNLVSESLTTPSASNTGSFNAHDLTFVIGHEVQHGFNAQVAAQARTAFVQDARALAATPGPVHDYTNLVERHIQSGREDEAKAEIAGWNALRSRVDHDRGHVTLGDMYTVAPSRAADFIEKRQGVYVPHANVQLNADLTMSSSPSNVAAMGHNYFDRPVSPKNGDTRQAMHLGHGGVEDYANYYGGWAVATIGGEERAAKHLMGPQPQIQIDMAHAGLNEEMMERAGLDLGKSKKSVPYLDGSVQPAVPHTFDHTADGPNQFQYVPVAPDRASNATRLDSPDHPDHSLFREARRHISALDQSLGRASDIHTDQLASAVAVQARSDGLQRVDQVALSINGDRLWSVQTPPGRTDHLFDLRSSVPTADAMTPMEASAAKWPAAMQLFEQAQAQKLAATQQPTQDVSQAQAAAMVHTLPGR